MTVLTQQVGDQYEGDGVTRFFAFSFDRLFDFQVFVSVDGRLVAYTVQQNGVLFDVAPAVGAVIKIFRLSDIVQPLDFQRFDRFPADKTEEAMDRLIILKQEGIEFRGKMNLLAWQQEITVTIINDKGSDAVNPLWRNDAAGMFAAIVAPSLPSNGAFDSRENYVFFGYDPTPDPDEFLSSLPYALLQDEQVQSSANLDAVILGEIPNDDVQSSASLDEITLEVVIEYTTEEVADDVQSSASLDEITLEAVIEYTTEEVSDDAQSSATLDQIDLEVVIAYVSHTQADGAESSATLDAITLSTP